MTNPDDKDLHEFVAELNDREPRWPKEDEDGEEEG